MRFYNTLRALRFLVDPATPIVPTVLGAQDTGLSYKTFWFTAEGVGGVLLFFMEDRQRVYVTGYVEDESVFIVGHHLRFSHYDLGCFAAFIRMNQSVIECYARGDEVILSRISSELADMLAQASEPIPYKIHS
ncbi:hypothetical protein SAMN04487964_1126 [Marinobacterium sediminicola]|uniref:YokE-like PH domain-containing protein n=1 Tax=Marinobacterium sediminicola TaxID=518898 RepID=A0ABY1S2H8_9GAMM|nr:hypothetical protein SAMN04487964_1126 [Marinobacterium sediminicola]